MDKNRLQYLLQLWVNNQIDKQQELELMRMLSLKDYVEESRVFAENIFHGSEDPITLSKDDADRIFLQSIGKEESYHIRPVHRIHFLKTAWFRYAAAVILFFSIGAYLWNYQSSNKKQTAATFKTNAVKSQDVNPGSNKAILVLGDESIINLDTALNGLISTQGNSEIIKTANGEIIYNPAISSNANIAYQKLITPKGGQYQVTLSDGTQVWLNAASSVRFPNVFTGEERRVEVTGEVYFDVTKNPKQPFVVVTPREKIIVLGTEFNVNTYLEEPHTRTSLVSGSVKILNSLSASPSNTGPILKPGEAYTNGTISKTNIDQDIAWKNGSFYFDDASLDNILRQFARWYDIEIIYEGKPTNKKFFGMVSRASTLSNVLKLLKANDISFEVEGKKLYVKSK